MLLLLSLWPYICQDLPLYYCLGVRGLRTFFKVLVVNVQAHNVCRIDPFCQRVEEDEELDFFQERLLFADFAASLYESACVE